MSSVPFVQRCVRSLPGRSGPHVDSQSGHKAIVNILRCAAEKCRMLMVYSLRRSFLFCFSFTRGIRSPRWVFLMEHLIQKGFHELIIYTLSYQSIMRGFSGALFSPPHRLIVPYRVAFRGIVLEKQCVFICSFLLLQRISARTPRFIYHQNK